MPNLRKKINRIAPAVVSVIMLISMSAAVYGQESTTTTAPSASETTTSASSSADTTTTPSQTTGSQTTGSGDPSTGTATTLDPAETTPEETTTEPPPPPSITLNFYERWLTVGDRVQLTAQLHNAPDYPNISFYSYNTDVAIVDASGNIAAVGAGYAAIAAWSGDITVWAQIYVAEPEVVPEFIVLNESNFFLKIDQTAEIQARLLPEEVAWEYTISFTSNDPSIATVDENGIITAISEGETTISVESAGLHETVYVTVSSDIAYDTARLDGYLYDNTGKPMSGSTLVIDGLSAVTDKDGFFVFDSVEQRRLTIQLAENKSAACQLTVSGDTTVYLLYDSGALKMLSSYDELAGQLAINKVKFDSTSIVLTVGEVYELNYQYEPSDATITGINYSSSNDVAAIVGQVDGVITAKNPGEATITINLNNGQATATCTVTVNPQESSRYSVLIIGIEAIVFTAGAAVVLLSYRSYRRKVLDMDDDGEDDLHDID